MFHKKVIAPTGEIVAIDQKVNIPQEFEIKNFSDFIKKYTLKNGKFNGRYNSVRERLLALKKVYNEHDPIEVLYDYYYVEELSYRDISKRLGEQGLYFPNTTLSHIFTKTFCWEVREHNEGTDITNRKNEAKYKKGFLSKLNNSRVQETNELVEQIIEGSKIRDETYSEYVLNTCKNKKKKVEYLLKLGGLPDIEQIALYSMQVGFGCNRRANVFMGLLEKVHDIDFLIDPREVDDWIGKDKKV